MVVFSFPDGDRLMWFGGRQVEATSADPARRLILMADALQAIQLTAADDDQAIREALGQLPGASVLLEAGDLRRYPH